MSTPDAATAKKIDEFRQLHAAGCFALPNPWDVGSARYLEHLGYRALATTSAGFGFAHGLPDRVDVLPIADVLQHCRELVAATGLPVSADFQNGYADAPEDVAANVAACLATGVAGLSIEDATGDASSPLYERELAIERVAAACAARDEAAAGAVLTARCEAWLVGAPDAERTALDRLVAFADAGADCLFAPGVCEPSQIRAIVSAVAPKPVNVLVAGSDTGLTVPLLQDLGVRRISTGSALARAAWGAFIRAATGIAERGSFDELAGAASFEHLDGVFAPPSDA